ncbi:MAG: family 16 glycosylhydrolase [Paludibacter sp.]|nr:family 16 glycosylhydrolase [Paludibacter sp.]
MKKALSLISLILLISSCNGSNSPGNEITSKLAVVDVIHERSSTSTTSYRFTINVTPTCSKPITVNYKTVDATAVAGKDYTALTGKLTIPANTLNAYIDVTVSKDSLRQEDQTFTLELSTPTNASISGTGKATGTIQNYGTYLPVDGTGYTGATTYPGMTLAWSDEFTANYINSNNWSYDTGGSGWGNNELEYYTNSNKNAYTTGGYLVIEARKETMGTNNYTSARMISKDKKTFTYGRIDFRAKLPKGQGVWPALWMLGNNIGTTPWPACGEIDIMELLGHEAQKTYGTIHWGAAGGASTHIGGNYSLPSLTFNDKFHLFSLKWEADKMTFLIDDVVFFTANKSQVNGNYPFDKPFFFIMNVAVGGNWPGNPDATTVFPQRMIVDYVRVFQ